ncbi:capsule assembly Wzi family protein [Nibrella saemangeumensis]|uniref:Capsule assembly Wzi family protein n=1 Tax=Nibrella saemangeumensis TaxID=1084526 RepID=A0ABP8MNN5_9BACT
MGPLTAYSQQTLPSLRPTHLFGEVGGFFAPAKPTPFWLQANQYGIVPDILPQSTFRLGLRHDEGHLYKEPDGRQPNGVVRRSFFRLGYGLEAVVNSHAGKSPQLILPEAYVKARAGVWEIWAGRRREVIGLADSTIGIGPYSWSGNALPIPKIQIALPEYTAIPFTGGLLAARGLYAHGWFANQGYVRGSRLHQKALYIRFGKPVWPVKFYGGINHQVQWGGQTENLPGGYIRNGQLPSGFGDYIDIVTAKSLGARPNVDTLKYSPFDRENRIGNHLGTVDVGVEFTNTNFSLSVYRQSIYEDGSLVYLTNITDGLHGLRFVNNRPAQGLFTVQRALLEFLNTTSQGGAVFQDSPAKLRGKDNYFNHGQYRDGWAYQGRTIGTPFITPASATLAGLPRHWFSNNTRVMAFHGALVGSIASRYTLTFKCSVSENLGTYDTPFSEPIWQLSSMMSLQVPLAQSGWQINTAFGLDRGALYANSTGLYIGVRKSWEKKVSVDKKSPNYFLRGRGF